MKKISIILLVAGAILLTSCKVECAERAIVKRPAVAIGGTVSGLPAGSTLILTNGDTDTVAIQSSGRYSFENKVATGDDYDVAVFGSTSGLSCTVSNGRGKVSLNADSINNINVVCVPSVMALIPFFIGVTVSGLRPGNTVTLTNNQTDAYTRTDILQANHNGFFIFRSHYVKEQVLSGRAGGYDVKVQTNPQHQVCNVNNASGAFPLGPSVGQPADFVNIPVVCR